MNIKGRFQHWHFFPFVPLTLPRRWQTGQSVSRQRRSNSDPLKVYCFWWQSYRHIDMLIPRVIDGLADIQSIAGRKKSLHQSDFSNVWAFCCQCDDGCDTRLFFLAHGERLHDGHDM